MAENKKSELKLYLISGIIVILCLFLLFDDQILFSLNQRSQSTPIGKLVQFRNEVRTKLSDQFYWSEVRGSDRVFDGQSIFADESSWAALTLLEDLELKVEPNSLIILALEGLELQLDLRFGEVLAIIKPGRELVLKRGDKKIRLGVKGQSSRGVIRLGKDIPGTYGFIVKEGSVDAQYEGQVVTLNPSTPYALNQRGQLIPVPPVEVTPTTAGTADFYRPQGAEPIKLEWKSTNADFFQVEVCETADCEKVALRRPVSKGNEIVIEDFLPSQKYWWRVQGQSEQNPLATSSELATMMVTFHPMAEIILPAENQTVIIPELKDGEEKTVKVPLDLKWSVSYPTTEFEWSIFSDREGKNKVAGGATKEMGLKSPELAPGKYLFTVQAIHSDGRLSQMAKKEFEFSLSSETLPLPPSDLRGPPSFIHPRPEDLVQAQGPLFQWSPSENAQSYRVEVSATADFKDPLTYDTTNPSFNWEAVRSGEWFVRVMALSPRGTPSSPSPVKSVKVKLVPPYLKPVPPLILPFSKNKGKEPPQKTTFVWTKLNEADQYEVEISDSLNAKKSLQKLANNQFELNAAQAGEYTLRVRPLDAKGLPLTPFSGSEKFKYSIKPMIEGPQLLTPKDQAQVTVRGSVDDFLWLVWEESSTMKQFEIEISTSPQFDRPLVREYVYRARFPLKDNLKVGPYYWRVRAVPPNQDTISDWSRPYRFDLQK